MRLYLTTQRYDSLDARGLVPARETAREAGRGTFFGSMLFPFLCPFPSYQVAD